MKPPPFPRHTEPHAHPPNPHPVIFESRPDVAVQIACLAIKSANGLILKGGKEAASTNAAIVAAIQAGLSSVTSEAGSVDEAVAAAVPPHAVQLVQSRDEVSALLKMHGKIDLIVPRGSNALVSHIIQNTRIPVRWRRALPRRSWHAPARGTGPSLRPGAPPATRCGPKGLVALPRRLWARLNASGTHRGRVRDASGTHPGRIAPHLSRSVFVGPSPCKRHASTHPPLLPPPPVL
eukprot:scaffold36288_cov110-Isochrysis_galbana.AAC.10